MTAKILWLSHLVPYPPKGGVLQRSYNLLFELSKYYDIFLVAFTQSALIKTHYPDYQNGISECKTELGKFCKHIEFIDIPQEKFRYGMTLTALKSLFSRESYTVNWLKSDEFMQSVNHLTSTVDFATIHFDTISLAYYNSSQIKTLKILDHHNIESHMMMRRAENERNLLKKIYFHIEARKILRYEKAVCAGFDLNITCSDLDSRRLQSLIPAANIIEIPNGVDLKYFNMSDDQQTEPKSLIFAGRLNAYTNRKAILYFINDIWPVLKSEIPELKLYVVGSNPPEQINNIDKDIIVTGFVDDVRPYLDNADIYICPITDGGGTKLKVLDALAMGKVIVGNQEAFEGIDVLHGESAMIANDANEYLMSINELFSNPQLKSKISKNARQLIESKYDYVSIGKTFHESIESLKND